MRSLYPQGAAGKILQDSYPLHKLKPVLENEDLPVDSVEVEKILNHKESDNNDIIDLVKWKDLPDDENSWIPEKYFNSYDLIKKYREKPKSNSNTKGLRRDIDQTSTNNNSNFMPKRRGRPRKNN